MILVVPVSQTDDEVLEDFVNVFNLFGPYPGHDLVVVSRPRDHILARETYRRIEHNFERGCKIHHTFDIDGRLGWPGGPNHYWLETAKYLKGDEYTNTDKPWLFLEMDMTPLCRGWADKLEAEYREEGMPFMGNLSWTTTTTGDQEMIKLCQHLVGAAIYPPDIEPYSKIWTYVNNINTAWDVLCQWEFPQHAHDTKLIQLCFRTCNYKKYVDELGNYFVQGDDREDWPDPTYTFSEPVNIGTAVLLHGCNDGSLARLVYEDVTGESVETEQQESIDD
jgi:hypothetical protein